MDRRTFIGAAGSATAGLLGTGAAAASVFDLQDDPLSEIEIRTDEYGVSHVYADDLYSLSYGNGYVQARDRLFQMDVLRLVGRGESARWLGPAQLPSDIQVKRDLYTDGEIDRQWADASPTIREAVRGYTDGVNRMILERAATGELPGEFAALGRPVEPWEPTDTVAAIDYLIGFFGVSGGSELGNAKSLARLTENLGDRETAFDAYGDLNWLHIREDHYTSVPERDLTVDGGESVPDSLADVPDEQLASVDAALEAETWGIEADVTLPEDLAEGQRTGRGLFASFKWGSNAVVVSGDLTESGESMLGGGAQMGYFKPPIPYEVGLHGAGYDMTGIGVVAAPALVIGRTPELCWTVTSGRDDQVDTIAVELDHEDPHRYRWNGEWHEMETTTVVHHPAPVGSAMAEEARTVVQEVARVHQAGDEMPVVAWNEAEDVAWVQRTTTRYDELKGAFIWAELGRSSAREGDETAMDDFERRLEEFPFTFNFHVVDDQGNVAYLHTGKVPERPDDVDLRLPRTPGTHAWTGMQVGAGLETNVRNPSRGYVVNWNNGPVAGWRAGDGEQNWGSIHRVEVLDHFTREYLGVPADAPASPETARNDLTWQDVADVIEDAATHDSVAQHSVPYLVDAGRSADDPQLRAMAEELTAWGETFCSWAEEDGRYADGGMAIWEEVRLELQAVAFEALGDRADELEFDPRESDDPHAADHGRAGKEVTFVDALALETNHGWLGETPRERDELIRAAMVRAAETLAERFDSEDPSTWRRPAHRSRFTPLGGAVPEEIPMSNRSSYPIVYEAGAGLEGAKATLPPGNSGHLNGPELAATAADESNEPDRLTDQLDLYEAYEYKPIPVTPEEVETAAVEDETLVATPERPVATRTSSTDADAGTLAVVRELYDGDLPEPTGAPGGESRPADRDDGADGEDGTDREDRPDGGDGDDEVDVPIDAPAPDLDDVGL